jgi:putative spermidine/putrescine transport system substrate-binding protein
MKSLDKIVCLVSMLVFITSFGFVANSYAENLTVVSWGGSYQEAQRKAYFDPFIKKTGLKVLDESWNGEMGKIRAMVETNNVTWDIVQIEAPELFTASEDGLCEEIDWNKIGSKSEMVSGAVMGKCGVGVIAFGVVMAYNADKIKGETPKSWADFWNVKKWPGKRALRKAPTQTMEIALLADGVPPADVYKLLSTEDGINRAFKKLDELRPNLLWWETGAQPAQWLAAGNIVMTSAWNGRIDTAIKEGHNFKIVWNGQLYNFDAWIIVKGSKNIDTAYKFLNFASKPENQIIVTKLTGYGPTNQKALPMIEKKMAKDLPTYPDNIKGGLQIDAQWWVEHQADLTERFNVWATQ